MFRNLMSMDVEETIRANPLDGVVLLTSCDKTTPAAVMGASSVDLPTTAVRIGDLMWTTFPGEMFSNIGKQVKAVSPATYAHLMGYTNGYVGYFPEQKAYSEGGYEVSRTHFDPQSEPIYLRQIAALMQRFR